MDENLNNALKAHDLYWTSYINGQVDVVASLLDENYQQIGSVEEEVFFNKKDAVEFVKKTIDQVAGKVEMRNRVTKSEKLSGYILINEFFDLYVKTGENWFFYAKFRTSSLMHQKADGWKLVHQHSSLPDSKAEEGENIAIEKINQENLELKNAIKRRTIELEHKNRELEIETALERVRAKAMAMRKSEELTDAAVVLFQELKKLGIEPRRCGFAIKQPEGLGWQFWHTTKDGQAIEKVGRLSEAQVPFFEDVFTAWKGGKAASHTSTFSGAELDHVIHFLIERTEVNLPDAETEVQQGIYPKQVCFNFFFFKHGSLLAHTLQPLKSEDRKLLERFARVFEQTYTRFLDLQKAEAQAIEATKQASLDRVRGEIASMRSTKDLEIITPLIWNELTTLGIPFIRCGVFIVHEEVEEVEVYLSKPDGTSLAVMHLPFGSSDLITQTVNAWQNSNVYTQHWAQNDFLNWGRTMMEQGQIPDFETYRSAETPPESLNLHFIPFNQGMLYVGSKNPLSDDEIDLAASLAEAFSIAYSRYEDFVKLEKAKARIEDALTELKTTQSQLIQQEKLASLGQLTAGIAHEIKNPLNFVNNFSDLSVELIQETREEIKSVGAIHKLPLQNVYDILDDIEANLRKIHAHGTRADGIVKSMLQHSRGGNGKMEPTNLNALIKEYANLAFHGMRAGKDPINVDIKLDLDEEIGEVDLIAEDFSRVILNISNNAFDAMRSLSAERFAQGESYQPKLTVKTHLKGETITIEIEDNGTGIPDKIKDKILQPFFTTKKGTAGTGLGLSITNDIVKAHGGVLEIETKKNKFTRFKIHLNHKQYMS